MQISNTARPEKWSSLGTVQILGTGRPEKMVAPYGDYAVGADPLFRSARFAYG